MQGFQCYSQCLHDPFRIIGNTFCVGVFSWRPFEDIEIGHQNQVGTDFKNIHNKIRGEHFSHSADTSWTIRRELDFGDMFIQFLGLQVQAETL